SMPMQYYTIVPNTQLCCFLSYIKMIQKDHVFNAHVCVTGSKSEVLWFSPGYQAMPFFFLLAFPPDFFVMRLPFSFLACRWLIHVGYCPCSSNWVVLLRLLSMSIFPSAMQKQKGVKTQDIGNDTECLICV
uniref:Uncharacterized protein n=1 Tax=Oncorhynchus tshawytscha TaxID=74940 RepID=A0A8C8ID65_ONCTS